MTTDARELADRLLDAQVAFVTSELTGPALGELVTAEVVELLTALEDRTVDEVVDRDAVQASVTAVLDAVGDAPGIGEAVTTLVDLLVHLPASDEHDLGEVVDRAAVAAVVDVLADSQTLREEVLRRLGRSPAVSTLAMRFVSALVGDAVQQNRERAEKVPGVKSLFGVGDFAARQARGMAPKQLEAAVGGAADKGAQAAMERVSRALVDTFDEDAVRRAAMELWDLHADERVAGARAYLTTPEVEAVTASGVAVWDGLHATTWFRTAVAAGVDAFFERYGSVTVAGLLGDFGLDHDTIAAAIARHAPQLVDVLHRSGHLEALVRRRLSPFFRSEAALAILAEG